MTNYPRAITGKFDKRWFVLTVFIAGCAGVNGRTVSGTPQQLSIEQLLSLPAKNGHSGVEEIVHALQALYGLEPESQLSPLENTQRPLILADGTVITQAVTDTRIRTPLWNEVALEIAEQPCFSIERAALLIGAKQIDNAPGDGKTLGRASYAFDSRAVRIELNAFDPDKRCVRSIWIYKNN